MTCKDCRNRDECEKESKTSPWLAHIAWLHDFWDNAEKRCRKFKQKTAHWYINPDGYYPQCSNCWEEPESGELEPICPNCGARMVSETT